MSDRPETLSELARRHVREGEERLARQAAIVARLERDNQPTAAALGRSILETIRTSLEMAKRHLRQIEEQSKS